MAHYFLGHNFEKVGLIQLLSTVLIAINLILTGGIIASSLLDFSNPIIGIVRDLIFTLPFSRKW